MGMHQDGVGCDSEEEHSQYLEALAHRRRREALAALQEQGESMTLVELSHHLMDAFRGPNQNEAKRLQLTLHHRHLPKLDDAGLVEFDPDEKTVTPTERALKISR